MNELKIVVENGKLKSCCTLEEKVVLPENQGIIFVFGDHSFDECKNMNELVLPEGVKEIGVFDISQPFTIWIPDTVEDADCLFINEEKMDSIVCSEKIALKICSGKLGSLAPMSGHRTLLNIKEGAKSYKVLISESYSSTMKLRCSLPSDGENFNFQEYDEILNNNKKYKLVPQERILAILCRLTYPKELEENYKKDYITFICKNIKKAIPVIIEHDDKNMLKLVFEIGAVTDKNKKDVIKMVSESKNDQLMEEIQSWL